MPTLSFVSAAPNSHRPAIAIALLAGSMLLAPAAALAQTAHFGGSESVVASSGLSAPSGVAVDAGGNVYISDTSHNRVLKVARSGGAYTETTVVSSNLSLPAGLAVDSSGIVYVADYDNSRVVKETPSAGGYTQSTVADHWSLKGPSGVAVDSGGNVYVADSIAKAVYKETPSPAGYIQSAIPAGALQMPISVAVDGGGNLYVTDAWDFSGAVYKIAAGGNKISTIGSGLVRPDAVAVDSGGDVYVCCDPHSARLLKETPSGGNYTQSVLPTTPVTRGNHALAVDGTGSVYLADSGTNRVFRESPSGGDFGTAEVGGAGPAMTVFFAFDTAGTLGSTEVLTQGAPNLDFNDARTGSCKAGTAYKAGDICSVDVTFTPRHGGVRYGAALLADQLGNSIAAGYVQGSGSGPQVNFWPGTFTTLVIGLNAPHAVAVDGSGSLYIADSGNNRVLKETLSGGKYVQSIVASGLANPDGVAVDGSGNVYIGDHTNKRVLKETPSKGTYTQSTILGLDAPNFRIAVDGGGSVYASDMTLAGVYKLTPSGGGYSQAFLRFAIDGIGAIAVDGAGSIYLANNEASYIAKETLTAKGYAPSILGNAVAAPWEIAVDGNGNLYVPDYGGKQILKFTPSASGYIKSTIDCGACTPMGIAVDGSGNLYISDSLNNRVLEMDFADPPSLSFKATNVGATSSDSPQTVTVENTGNAALTFPVPKTGNNPSIAPNFTLNSSGASACPLLTSNSSQAGTLAAGESCLLPISFTPQAEGALTGSLVLADNALNAASPAWATQSIPLSGVGNGKAPAPTITSLSPSSAAAGGPAFTLTINGTNFTTKAGVMWSSTMVGSTYISATQLTAQIPASLIATPYTAWVTVMDGVARPRATFLVYPAPTAAPAFSVASGTYSAVQTVAITDAALNSAIYYTVDGNTPTASSTRYTGPIWVNASETIKAMAVAPNQGNSTVASASYTLIGSPSALAAPATAVSTPNATLNAVVNTMGLAGACYFQYGTSSKALTASTSGTALGASAAAVPVSAQLTNLKAKTTYYYQVVATTAGGTATGAVVRFTTN